MQQGCPDDPQAAQLDPAQIVNGAVQPASPAQHGPPATPHVPPPQPPAAHIPCPAPHVDPDATHDPATQHPSLLHTTPSQHGCPVPPHAAQEPFRPQVSPAAVQKSAECPWPPGAPTQQPWPVAPQPPQLSVLAQVPRAPPQVCPLATHDPPAQQRLLLQVALSQHGCPVAPQATICPDTQRLPTVGDDPLGLHVPLEQQPPDPHAPLLQQGCPAFPHATTPPSAQRPPSEGEPPAATQEPATQHPPALHALPAQHGSPGAPHAAPVSPACAESGAASTPDSLFSWGAVSALTSDTVASDRGSAASWSSPLPESVPAASPETPTAPSTTTNRSKSYPQPAAIRARSDVTDVTVAAAVAALSDAMTRRACPTSPSLPCGRNEVGRRVCLRR
jgi:hypothetical protein